jgi:hypothetical protein
MKARPPPPYVRNLRRGRKINEIFDLTDEYTSLSMQRHIGSELCRSCAVPESDRRFV